MYETGDLHVVWFVLLWLILNERGGLKVLLVPATKARKQMRIEQSGDKVKAEIY